MVTIEGGFAPDLSILLGLAVSCLKELLHGLVHGAERLGKITQRRLGGLDVGVYRLGNRPQLGAKRYLLDGSSSHEQSIPQAGGPA